jgi:hypothetical protein
MISSGGRLREAADSAWWTKVIFSYRRLGRNPQSLQYASHCTLSTNHMMPKRKLEDILRPEGRVYTPLADCDRGKIAVLFGFSAT